MKAPTTLFAKVQISFTEKRSATFRIPVARMRFAPELTRRADGTALLNARITVLPWMRWLLVAIRALRAVRLCHRVEVSDA